jgi:predicted negative regulator of RcsB-dependent stress response
VSDYLTDEEQLARLKSWWDENGISTIVGLVLVVVGVVGWRWYDSYREDAIAKASDLYHEFLASEGVARDTIAQTISSEVAGTAYHALALMHLARDAVASGDYDGADLHLQAAISAAPEPELADIARLRLARVQQQGDRSDAALQTLGAIRGEGFRSHVAELKGDIHLARGERLLAHESYSAGLADETDQNRRPILEMKVADTADSLNAQSAAAEELVNEIVDEVIEDVVEEVVDEVGDGVVAEETAQDMGEVGSTEAEVQAPDA